MVPSYFSFCMGSCEALNSKVPQPMAVLSSKLSLLVRSTLAVRTPRSGGGQEVKSSLQQRGPSRGRPAYSRREFRSPSCRAGLLSPPRPCQQPPLWLARRLSLLSPQPIAPGEELLVWYNGEDNPEIAAAIEEERASARSKRSSPKSRKGRSPQPPAPPPLRAQARRSPWLGDLFRAGCWPAPRPPRDAAESRHRTPLGLFSNLGPGMRAWRSARTPAPPEGWLSLHLRTSKIAGLAGGSSSRSLQSRARPVYS